MLGKYMSSLHNPTFNNSSYPKNIPVPYLMLFVVEVDTLNLCTTIVNNKSLISVF